MKKLFLFAGLISLLLFASSVFAIPQFPHVFYGTVTVNGNPAPDGTKVSAKTSIGEVITNSQNPVKTVNGNYGIDGLSLLVQGEELSGIVKFYVDGIDTGITRPFSYDGGPTEVNLSVTKTGGDSGGGASGGSSGGSSSGSSGSTQTPTTETTTQEKTLVSKITNIEDINDILNKTNLTDDEKKEYLDAFSQGFLEFQRELSVERTTTNGKTEFISTITLIVRNNSDNQISDIKIIETIPKDIAEIVAEITPLYSFRVLIEDPVLELTIPLIKPLQTITIPLYKVNKEITKEQFKKIPGIISKATVVPTTITPEDKPGTDDKPTEGNEGYTSVEKTSTKNSNLLLWIVLIVIILAIIGYLVFSKKKSKRKKL